jgi:hypothetical protein
MTMQAENPKVDTPSWADVMRQAIDKFDGDIEAATNMVVELLLADMVLLKKRLPVMVRKHTHPCPRCSAAGSPPAPIDSPVKEGHKAAHALRVVGKELLKDLWREANHLKTDTHGGLVADRHRVGASSAPPVNAARSVA